MEDKNFLKLVDAALNQHGEALLGYNLTLHLKKTLTKGSNMPITSEESLGYYFEGEEYTVDLTLQKTATSSEKGGYKEPDTEIYSSTFFGESEHGTFKFTASARRSGFDTYFEIDDDIEITIPKGCELTHGHPHFEFKDDEDESEF